MINTVRLVNIRGYIREVYIVGQCREKEWTVKDGRREECVPEHLFYHQSEFGIVLRDSVEFRRNFDNHPIDIEKVFATKI